MDDLIVTVISYLYSCNVSDQSFQSIETETEILNIGQPSGV